MLVSSKIPEEQIKSMLEMGEIDPSQIDLTLLPEGTALN